MMSCQGVLHRDFQPVILSIPFDQDHLFVGGDNIWLMSHFHDPHSLNSKYKSTPLPFGPDH